MITRSGKLRLEYLSASIFGLFFLPLVLALIGQALEVLPPSFGNLLRVSAHLVFLLIISFALQRESQRHVIGEDFYLTTLVSLMMTVLLLVFAFLSLYYNQIQIDQILRVSTLAIFLFNLLVLYPALFQLLNEPRKYSYVVRLCGAYILFSALLATYSAFSFFSGTSPYSRLGYPLSPGVFAFYMLVAYLISLTVRRSSVKSIFFSAAIILSGSRSALALLLLFTGLFGLRYLKQKRTIILVVMSVVIVPLLIYYLDRDLLRAFFAEREDISSGRFFIWNQLLSFLRNHGTFLFGTGLPPTVDFRDRDIGAHNSFLDAAITYGVPFAVLIYLVWFTRFFPRKPRKLLPRQDGFQSVQLQLYTLQLMLFILVTAKSLVTNTFWVNMGDPATLFASLVILCPSVSASSKSRRANEGAVLTTLRVNNLSE